MTNGQLTKKILAAAKTLQGDDLRQELDRLMMMFPLSSHKLVYDNDAQKVTPEAWTVVLEVAVATDKRKLDSLNTLYKDTGMGSETTFGRYHR